MTPSGPAWRAGDSWPILLTLSEPRKAAQQYQMHVVVTGSQKVGSAECWRLEFILVNAPADVGAGYRVLVDKADGALRRIFPLGVGGAAKTPEPAGLRFPLEPAAAEQGARPRAARQAKKRAPAARQEWSGSRTWARKAQSVTGGANRRSRQETPSSRRAWSTWSAVRASAKGRPGARAKTSWARPTWRVRRVGLVPVPRRRQQGVIPPEQSAEFVCQMEDVLEVYPRPYDPRRPQGCLDEASQQLVAQVRGPVPAARAGRRARTTSTSGRGRTTCSWCARPWPASGACR